MLEGRGGRLKEMDIFTELFPRVSGTLFTNRISLICITVYSLYNVGGLYGIFDSLIYKVSLVSLSGWCARFVIILQLNYLLFFASRELNVDTNNETKSYSSPFQKGKLVQPSLIGVMVFIPV